MKSKKNYEKMELESMKRIIEFINKILKDSDNLQELKFLQEPWHREMTKYLKSKIEEMEKMETIYKEEFDKLIIFYEKYLSLTGSMSSFELPVNEIARIFNLAEEVTKIARGVE